MKDEINNSVNYIESKAGKTTSFSAPSGYLDNIEDDVITKLVEQDFKKDLPFKVADTYFDNIEDIILSSVSSTEKVTKVISFKDRFLKAIPIAAAASVVLFIGLNSFVFNKNKEFTIDNLNDDDIEYWLESNTMNSNDIAVILQNDILEENVFSFVDIKDETIEDYINSIDNTYLLNELN